MKKMMTLMLAAVLTLGCSSPALASANPPEYVCIYSVERNGTSGSVYERMYEYNELGQRTATYSMHDGAKDKLEEEYIYEDELLRKTVTYDSLDGSVSGSREYQYDSDGHVISEHVEQFGFSYDSTYEYVDGRISKEVPVPGNNSPGRLGCTEYRYDSLGQLVEKDAYDADNILYSTYKYDYDQNGNCVSEDWDGGFSSYSRKYEYVTLDDYLSGNYKIVPQSFR